MQTQTIYVRAGSVLATWVDSANQTSSASFPTLARGQRAELVIGFFADENADSVHDGHSFLVVDLVGIFESCVADGDEGHGHDQRQHQSE